MYESTAYRLGMLGAIVVVLLNTWVAASSLHTLFDAQYWQAHTQEVLTQTEAIALQDRSADAAARGFLLSGQESFQKRYNDSYNALESSVERLQQLTGDNASQQDRIRYMRGRIAVKFAALDLAMGQYAGRSHGAGDPMLKTVLLDSVDGGPTVQWCIAQVEGEERRLLAEREAKTLHQRHRLIGTFVLAAALDLLLVVIAFELLVRAERSRLALTEHAQEIDRLNADLQEANATLEARVEERTCELQASNQELEAFSYSVSHDLRAPLRTIDGFSLALKEDFADLLNEEGLDYIDRVRGGVQRMGMLIDALLQLSRVTRSELQRDKVDLSQLARAVFNEVRAADLEREVSFTAQPGVVVMADPRLMRIALENLIGNAWKFTSKTTGARIEFGSGSQGDQTVYFIRDNGAGFDMQYVDRLFTAFQRLHGDRDFKGSGIGLATVSRIIRRHHGTIWAESELDHGATFYFTLTP